MWQMTAAQRALMVGGKTKQTRRLSLEEMIKMTSENIGSDDDPADIEVPV